MDQGSSRGEVVLASEAVLPAERAFVVRLRAQPDRRGISSPVVGRCVKGAPSDRQERAGQGRQAARTTLTPTGSSRKVAGINSGCCGASGAPLRTGGESMNRTTIWTLILS